MSDNWIPIARKRTDGLVSIMVNARYRDEGLVPDPSRPSATRIRVAFKNPEHHGMGDVADSGAIDDVMDELGPRLASELSAEYVGRVRGGGYARIWVYSAPGSRERIEHMAQQAFAGRTIDVEHQDDPDWDMYVGMTPSHAEERLILDLRVIDVLKENGDLLTPKRDVRHYIYFADRGAASRFAQQAAAQGFKTDLSQVENPTDGRPWGVCASRDDSVEHPQISEITRGLMDMAVNLGGFYDGWEAKLVKEEEKQKKGLFGKLFKK